MNQEQTARTTATTLVCKCFAMATASDGNTMPLTLREHLIDAVAELARRASSAEKANGPPNGSAYMLAQETITTLTSERDEARERCQRLLDHCPDAECSTCGAIMCPHKDEMHFHHDGCPSCHTSALTQPEGTQPQKESTTKGRAGA